ncbi:MAG: rod shape-determining protein RodA [Clostridia bacterium]|nr:rod shape-determining protein RodA [Clostridia bacterium]
MLKSLLKNTDYIILTAVIILFIIGIVGIYSAGYNTTLNKDEYIKQIIWFSAMFVVMIVIWSIDYTVFDIVGYIMYFFSIVLLVLVLFTPSLMGAKSWFNFGSFLYQPSELMKIAYILTMSKVLSLHLESGKSKILRNIVAFLIFCIPIGLILLQPDFGTAMTFIFITIFMLYANGLKYRYIFLAFILIAIAAPLIYYFVLNPIQQERILVFLDPTRDPLGSGYNAIQSKLAVGSGMFFGTGLLSGTQTQFGYLPIKSSDFIFSVISEELGFIFSTLIVILYTVLIIRIIYVSKRAKDKFAKLTVIGIAGIFFFHFVQNIGMTIGLLPITGVPLPFVSYGGSNLMTSMMAIGIVLNVSARKSKNMFLD